MSRKEMDCVQSIEGMRISGLMKMGCCEPSDAGLQCRQVKVINHLLHIKV